MEAKMEGFWPRMVATSPYVGRKEGRSDRATVTILHHVIINLEASNLPPFLLQEIFLLSFL